MMRAMVMGAAAACLAGGAGATTLVIDFQSGKYLNEMSTGTYVEDGVTVTANDEDLFVGGLVEEGGDGSATALTFTTGGLFSVKSMDFTPLLFSSRLCNYSLSRDPCASFTYDNVRITGYRDGALVAAEVFDQSRVAAENEAAPYTFGEGFTSIDRLVFGGAEIAINLPPTSDYVLECGYPCWRYRIDNVALELAGSPAPVPLPASAALLAGALAGIGVVRKRSAPLARQSGR